MKELCSAKELNIPVSPWYDTAELLNIPVSPWYDTAELLQVVVKHHNMQGEGSRNLSVG